MTWEENGTETLRVPTFSLVLTSLINRQRNGVSSLKAIIDQNDRTIGLNQDKTATSTL